MLISTEYRDLCNQLHREDPEWGNSVHPRNVQVLLECCKRLGTYDVLDYGCGKGALQRKFPYEIKEYDPAIVGKHNKNIPSDIVVCFDVLEHIEPECLNDVLKDIARCTLKLALINIATGPANAKLSDGRNAHLIQKPFSWWKEELEKYFKIVKAYEAFHDNPKKSELRLILIPLSIFKEEEAKSDTRELVYFNTHETKFGKSGEIIDLLQFEMVHFGEFQPVAYFPGNLEYSLRHIPKERWWDYPVDPDASKKKVAIVGYGPSLHDSWKFLKEQKYDLIFTVSGSHNFLLERGIKPTHHVEIDWKPHKHKFTDDAQKGITYIISSVCSPKIIDNVKDLDSYLIFIQHGDQIVYPEDAHVRDFGFDVGQTALVIAYEMGYREIDLYGFDYSFDREKHRHAGEHGGRTHFLLKGKVGDKVFYTSKTMFTSLLVMEYWLKRHPDLLINIYSDTLFVHFLEGKEQILQQRRKENK